MWKADSIYIATVFGALGDFLKKYNTWYKFMLYQPTLSLIKK